jgi:esterase/lipase
MGSIQAAIFASIFAAGLGLGGSVAYRVQQYKIDELRLSIAESNNKSQEMLIQSAKQVKIIEENQLANAQRSEIEHEKVIQENNALSTKLHDAIEHYRMRHDNKTSCPDRVSKIDNTVVPAEPAATTDNAEGFNRILERDAKIADDNAEYAKKAYEWIQSIPKELRK